MLNNEILFALILSFTFSFLSGFIFIPILRKIKMGQSIRNDGPKTHLKKTGTPTIGGVIIFTGIVIGGCIFGPKYKMLYPIIFFTISCGIIGFIDDYIKVTQKRSLGLTALKKMVGLIFVSVTFSIYIFNFTNIGTGIIIPFFSDYLFDLKALYIPFTVFFILATVNSVNLTDGLDGLASGITIIVSVFFTIAALMQNNIIIAVFSALIAGSTLGFFIFNIHPAKVFMGDTGSLALGAAISAIAIVLKMPLFIIIVGFIFLLESVSVIIQVFSFKIFQKRVFKMTPIHHHFELLGWKETKVVLSFWGLSAIFSILGYLALI